MQVRPAEDQNDRRYIPLQRDNPDWTGTVNHMHKTFHTHRHAYMHACAQTERNTHTHTHTCCKSPQILPSGCYDCRSVPTVIEMKACPQEGSSYFFLPLLSINTDATPSTITTLLSITALCTRELLAHKNVFGAVTSEALQNRWLFLI